MRAINDHAQEVVPSVVTLLLLEALVDNQSTTQATGHESTRIMESNQPADLVVKSTEMLTVTINPTRGCHNDDAIGWTGFALKYIIVWRIFW